MCLSLSVAALLLALSAYQSMEKICYVSHTLHISLTHNHKMISRVPHVYYRPLCSVDPPQCVSPHLSQVLKVGLQCGKKTNVFE